MAPRIQKTEFVLDNIFIHGNLIASEQIHQLCVAPQNVHALSDYRIPKGFDINNAVHNYFITAKAYWEDFQYLRQAIEQATEKVIEQATESTSQFIFHLLKEVFGFIDPVILTKADDQKPPRVPVIVAPYRY